MTGCWFRAPGKHSAHLFLRPSAACPGPLIRRNSLLPRVMVLSSPSPPNPHCTCSAHLKPCGMGGHFWLQNLPLMWKGGTCPRFRRCQVCLRPGPLGRLRKQTSMLASASYSCTVTYPIWGGRAGLFSTQSCDNGRHLNKRTLQPDRA